MPGPLLALLLACSGEPTAPPPADRPAGGPELSPPPTAPTSLAPGRGRSVVHLLDRVTAEGLELPADNLPADLAETRRVVLDSGWRKAEWSDGRVWQHPTPLDLPRDRYRAAPAGVTLLSGERSLAYDPRIVEDGSLSQRWVVWQDTLYLSSRLDPGKWPEPPVLELAGAAWREAAWNLARSGLAPVDFARRSETIGALTHPCLYLPAPARATLPVEVPAGGGTLVMGAGLVVPDGVEPTAAAVLELRIDDQPVDRAALQAGLAWTELRTDLAPWAGQAVTLTLESRPGADPSRDYLCVADPRVLGPAPEAPDPVRVVVVGIDTLRVDHLGVHGYPRPTSPVLDTLASQAVRFPNTWAPAPRTRPSFRSSTTGRWPLRALTAPGFGRVLAEHGLSTAGIVANVHLAPRLGFADGFQHYSYDNGAGADVQVDRALAWLDAHRDEDAFLFLHLMDPHTFYLAPEPFRDRFTQGIDRGHVPDRFNRWMVAGWQERGQLSEEEKRFIAGRYDGEVAFTDHELGRLVAALDALPGRTLLVVHTDHGEELWDHGGFEHNHSLYDELTRALLWLRGPGLQPAVLDQPASLADLPPTLYEALGVPRDRWPEVDGTSLWPLVAGTDAAPRLAATLDRRPLHLGYLMFDRERWAVVARDAAGVLHKYVLVTTTGQEQLFDLQADPGEQHDLAAAPGFDPAPWAAALEAATGWPVGPGWRLHLHQAREPLTLRFSEPVRAAGVLDPEAGLVRRANLEWGELPVLGPDDVARVERSADGRTVEIRPGGHGTGTVYVLGPGAADRAQRADGTEVGPGLVALADGTVQVDAGTVIVPLESEAAALAAALAATLAGGGAQAQDPSDAQLEALRALGYLDGE